MLRNIRTQDQAQRSQKNLYQTESSLSTQARATASPSEIQRMIEEDKAKGLPKEEWRAYQW